MKRGMVGGAYRGPVGVGRQRRTIRLMQVILVVIAALLLLFAGYSLGKRSGFDDGRRASEIDAPKRPTVGQTVALTLFGLMLIGAALGLQTEGGVRLLTPARLRELEDAGAEPLLMATEEEEELPTV